jgi:solute carrier family 4 anion exchanger 2
MEVKVRRLSALLVLVVVFVWLSFTIAPLLHLVLISVLFGIFLYTGISNGIQFFGRLKLFFTPVKHRFLPIV